MEGISAHLLSFDDDADSGKLIDKRVFYSFW
jgi:hypothetical protein